MSANTKIQWCDHTHNPWRGCRKVAPECANCYITRTVPFRTRGQKHGSERVRAGAATLREPLTWNTKPVICDFCGKSFPCEQAHVCIPPGHIRAAGQLSWHRPRVFCLSLGDWLDDEVPTEWLVELLATIHATPNLDWLLLTKRPGNFKARMKAVFERTLDWGAAENFAANWLAHVIPKNVWIGVSAGADQAAALAIPARIHFLSAEPMLHPLDTTHAAHFDWIIFGGESGPGARACDITWIREGVKFCREHHIAPFVKQLGANCGQQLRDKKGGDMAEWPEDLRVREFPTCKP